MKESWFIIIVFLASTVSCISQETNLTLAVTTDVHGMIYPYDFISQSASSNSLAHVHSYASERRLREDTLFFLLDNGDFLQGQPSVYYYNFIDTVSEHLSAKIMNFMDYAAGTVGNHDIETGPAVYDKFRGEIRFPWLAANAVRTESGTPYFEPYTILKAGDKKIAILGLITPGIPHWLPKNLWPDMEFNDMVESAQKWIVAIRELEKPDAIVGLFHSGTDSGYGVYSGPHMNENAVLLVAENVPGFDVIFAGHDHRVSLQWIVNVTGDSVLVVDPGSHGRYVGEVNISFDREGQKTISGRNVGMKEYEPSTEIQDEFSTERRRIETYLEDTITFLKRDLNVSEALFGPSRMLTLIHNLQLKLSGADLSFSAPLSLSSKLEVGPLLVSDMFKLYRYENMLYTMELTGFEIDAILEYASGMWFKGMNNSSDDLLYYVPGEPGRLANPYYNFSSAAGIEYAVDLRKPAGERVSIQTFSDGREFHPDSTYLVAVNSYRGNGGGGHLVKGAGIPANSLSDKVIRSTEKDLRYHLAEELSKADTLDVKNAKNWTILPQNWVQSAIGREKKYFD